MNTKQPTWRVVGRIGDVNPVDYGGGIVLVDDTGVYAPELEFYEAESDSDDSVVQVYRVSLEPHTFEGGVLSDNPYHRDYPVWYADRLERVACTMDCTVDDMVSSLCGNDPIAKAIVYHDLASYFGWVEFDNYPLELTRAEAEARLARECLG